ncbi:glycosyl hydrolase [Pedobacter sp. PF22-3]|uniref:glycosyl hydrolase n=1 Tax=Pedobacter sp. PF22-3 TaxID=2994467 RepID=UPI0022478058|nr:glycosyl hydrolase [Pedobacter sp. PF22-3]MCX2493019.1 glycosyl hydrolase [Pedobacter sp. PF22-3]
MKKNLFKVAIAMLLLAGCAKNQTQPEFSSEISADKQKITNADLLATATIDAGTVQQTIKGFGGANIVAWTGDLTSTQRNTAFSPTSGIGLSIVRVRVPNSSSEFAAEKATIDACKSFGGSAIASAWSAPASMKTNGSIVGGKIKTTSYANYAAHLSAFNTAVGGLAAISPTNEPDYKVNYESMELTAPEVADFVAAQGSNCGAPIMAPEPFQMNQTYINNYLSNATAKSKTSFVCGHIYGKTPYNLGNIGKPVWMTEHYTNSNISGEDWSNAMTAAKEIHDCMNSGWSAYVWWYIRRSYGPISESGNIQKIGYVIAQYARYVRPGFNKIACSENPSTGVYATAYKSGTKLVVVIINQNAATTYQSFNFSGITVSGFNRYFTTSSANLSTNSFAVTGSNFGINLAPSSVTTLVSY